MILFDALYYLAFRFSCFLKYDLHSDRIPDEYQGGGLFLGIIIILDVISLSKLEILPVELTDLKMLLILVFTFASIYLIFRKRARQIVTKFSTGAFKLRRLYLFWGYCYYLGSILLIFLSAQ